MLKQHHESAAGAFYRIIQNGYCPLAGPLTSCFGFSRLVRIQMPQPGFKPATSCIAEQHLSDCAPMAGALLDCSAC